MNRLITGLLRSVVLGVIWRGVDKATDHVAKRKAQNSQTDPAKTTRAKPYAPNHADAAPFHTV